MDILVKLADVSEKQTVANLMELYRHDFSEFDDRDVDTEGLFGYPYLDFYWTEPERHAYLIRAGEVLAGFALVREMHPTEMLEFFVLRRYRRRGVGRLAATQILQLFPGEWRLTQMAANRDATQFWRQIIPANFVERDLDSGVVEQRFTIVRS